MPLSPSQPSACSLPPSTHCGHNCFHVPCHALSGGRHSRSSTRRWEQVSASAASPPARCSDQSAPGARSRLPERSLSSQPRQGSWQPHAPQPMVPPGQCHEGSSRVVDGRRSGVVVGSLLSQEVLRLPDELARSRRVAGSPGVRRRVFPVRVSPDVGANRASIYRVSLVLIRASGAAALRRRGRHDFPVGAM